MIDCRRDDIMLAGTTSLICHRLFASGTFVLETKYGCEHASKQEVAEDQQMALLLNYLCDRHGLDKLIRSTLSASTWIILSYPVEENTSRAQSLEKPGKADLNLTSDHSPLRSEKV